VGVGWRQQERYIKSNLQKTTSFIVVESLDVPPEHTNLHPARRVDNVFLPFFNQRCQNSVRPASPDFRVEADWLKCAAPQTEVTLLASRYPLSHDSRTLATMVAKRRAKGRDSQSEQNGRFLAMRNFTKKMYEF